MKRLNLYTSILCLGLAASLPVHAQNGNSRGASNGQPFQELQSAIDAAEEAVNAAIDANTARIDANESAIEANTAATSANASAIDANSAAIQANTAATGANASAISAEAAAREAGDSAVAAEAAAAVAQEAAARISGIAQLRSGLMSSIISLEEDVNDVSGRLSNLEGQVLVNAEDIAGAMEEIGFLNAALANVSGAILSELHDLQFQHQADIADIRNQLAGLRFEVDSLSIGLNELSLQLGQELLAMQAAIDANSADIGNLMASVTLLNGQMSVAQAEITDLLSRVGLAEQALAQQESDLQSLAGALAGLDARMQLLENQPSGDELLLVDTTADDFDGSELADFFSSVSVSSSSFILVEASTSRQGTYAWCSTNAAWYVNNYLGNYQGSSYLVSGSWDKWYKDNGGVWNHTNASHGNYYGSACGGGASGWCSEWGIGGLAFNGYLPNWSYGASSLNGSEMYNREGSYGDGTLRIKVGESRAQTCGF